MERYAWAAKLRPDKLDAYMRLHEQLWPEMTAMLHEAGIRNYTIWTDGISLFGYYSTYYRKTHTCDLQCFEGFAKVFLWKDRQQHAG